MNQIQNDTDLLCSQHVTLNKIRKMRKLILLICSFLIIVSQVISQEFTSNLPIVVLTTNGTNIPDEPKVLIHMGIIDNGTGEINSILDSYNGYDGNIGIELRGNSTFEHPKKSWSFELRDEQNEDINAEILGMPAEEDWILKASWLDKTFMRDIVPFNQWIELGYWAPRTRMCEVFLDDDYLGLYIMYEKIKRDNNRVDIAKLDNDDLQGDSLTGGYIVGLGWDDGVSWDSNYLTTTGEDFGFHLRYPKNGNSQAEQENYIMAYIDSFEVAINSADYYHPNGNHYSDFIDVKSFMHHFFINEISRNVDGLKQSTYLHKDKDSKGGKLSFSALWDYDVAYGNIEYCDSGEPEGWAYLYDSNCDGEWFQDVPTWWVRLMDDPHFVNELKCEWLTLRQDIFHLNSIFTNIDSIATLIDAAQERNFVKWPVIGDNLEAFPAEIPGSFIGEVEYLKDWFSQRILWLDANMPGLCTTSIGRHKEGSMTVYPNPASSLVYIESNIQDTVKVINSLGELIMEELVYPGINTLDFSKFSSGVYELRYTSTESNRLIIH